MKLLIKENNIDWQSFLMNIQPQIDYYKINNKFSEITLRERLRWEVFNVFVFDINENPKEELDLLYKLKIYNPDLRSIVITSTDKRKYRYPLASKSVDHFLFRECELDLLTQVITQINLKLTRECRA